MWAWNNQEICSWRRGHCHRCRVFSQLSLTCPSLGTQGWFLLFQAEYRGGEGARVTVRGSWGWGKMDRKVKAYPRETFMVTYHHCCKKLVKCLQFLYTLSLGLSGFFGLSLISASLMCSF